MRHQADSWDKPKSGNRVGSREGGGAGKDGGQATDKTIEPGTGVKVLECGCKER